LFLKWAKSVTLGGSKKTNRHYFADIHRIRLATPL
jgi:hypothetical protein